MIRDCDTCFHNSRVIVSENGIHTVCCLSNRAAFKCVTGEKDRYVKNPSAKENTDD